MDKLARTIHRFQAKIDSGSFYEAHQTLRTIINRYVKSKQYTESIDLLYQGSIILAKNKEYTSASDLILYLIEILKESGTTIENTDTKAKIIELVNYIPNSDTSLPDLSKVIIEWSKTESSKFGDGDLHSLFGVKFLGAVAGATEKSKVFSVGEFHCIFGNVNSLNAYIDFLFEMSITNDEDPGIYLLRAVINYGYVKNLEFVKLSIEKFVKKLEGPSEKVGDVLFFKQYKLVNFSQLLYGTLKRDAGNKFLKLYDTYKSELVRVDMLGPVEYLGRFYFGLNLGSANKNSNMFADLMGGLFK